MDFFEDLYKSYGFMNIETTQLDHRGIKSFTVWENVKPMQNPVSVSSLFGTDCIELVKLKNIKYLE